MNRYKCPACGGEQYTAADTAEGCIYCGNKELKKMETLARRNSMRLIDAVPVVCGEWKRGREFSSYPRVPFISDAYYCSNCEEEAYWDTDYGQQLFGFCPNCGAKMEVEP
jgi:DNA-directed RNA polymerase subunit RPC12/RpoP